MLCPLCKCKEHSVYIQHQRSEYRLCSKCSLVFVIESQRLDENDEKSRYDLHVNSPDDEHYRKYLSKVYEPVRDRVKEGSFGLDFGSGPGPTLSKMFEEGGFKMNIYDHFYAKDEKVLHEGYDFITSSEVVEHLYEPKEVLDALWAIINKEGILCLLTQPYPSKENFSSWYYKNDPTHVCFFSKESMEFLANKWMSNLEIVGKDIFIFRKS
ncbi:MAG TPA: class I SAM-dependent methyltransferase [Sulfurimonas sp.]|nr:class I SAM-dependent methyltransferase [Sulfurimonas sp.]